MRVNARIALAVLTSVGFCHSSVAMVQDDTSVVGLTILTVDDNDDFVEVELQIEAWLDEGRRVALTGSSSMLGLLKPDRVYAWPTTNTIVLDSADGLGIFGFDATDAAHRLKILSGWVWAEREAVGESVVRDVRSADSPNRSFDLTFDLTASSPSSLCRAFRRKLATTLFSHRLPDVEEKRVFASEMRRWCQYGNLSVRLAEPPQFTIAPFRSTDEPRLSVVAEWGLFRNDDPLDPKGTTFLLWTKTVGEGGGSGFGRRDGTEGYFDAVGGGMRRLLDASIHSGWGPTRNDDVGSAWPVDSSFPRSSKTNLFLCEVPDAPDLPGCPREPRLRSLYPADSIDGVVTVSRAERFIVGGNAQAGVSVDTTGKVTPNMSFSLNIVKATTDVAQSEMQLVQTRTSADSVFYRATRWTPDIPALYRWVNAREHAGSLAQATPLAATLNPQYEIIWELPLRGNEGRKLSYSMIYEAGWNTCFNGPNCATPAQPPDRTLQAKARVGWSDSIKLMMPYD
ncbi:MAG TPA: hypothetical protein VM621_03390 [Luteibacter sp.]|uniref:hypothetical protein n=1 Tax=Luteibacter sp. TaxID=1886636 RepID=UPI002C3D7805|nr:hypothetical protein [Luteibacter sp.]HVI54082.1 hypothetical protein [Luteibacter sp.]